MICGSALIWLLLCTFAIVLCQGGEHSTAGRESNDFDRPAGTSPATASATASQSKQQQQQAQYEQSNSSRRYNPFDEELSEEHKRELRAKQREARRLKLLKERKRNGEQAAQHILRASQSDGCDWRTNPLAALRGELCGSHYKVLGLSRKRELDKPSVKKAYRATSLTVHPDKNPSDDAQSAFKIVQDAYECLQDEACKETYDHRLAVKEEAIYWQRSQFKEMLMEKALAALGRARRAVSLAAHHVLRFGHSAWRWAGEYEVSVMDTDWPLGQPLMLLLLVWKGRPLLLLHCLAFAIERINYEFAS